LQFKLAEEIINQLYPKEASDFLETLKKINMTILQADYKVNQAETAMRGKDKTALKKSIFSLTVVIL